MPVTCDFCGRVEDVDHPPLDWSLGVERGQVKRYCERCTRLYLRGMEGKLDAEQW